MPLIPALSVSNNSVNTNTFTVNDLSTGSDVAITNRLLFLYDASNNLLTGAPIQFPLSAGASISPAILTQDAAYNVVLQWVNSSNAPLYTASQILVFTGFLESFFYSLTQRIAAQSSILSDTNFFSNYSKLRTLIDSANQAISIGNSIFNAQAMILLAQFLQTNTNLYF